MNVGDMVADFSAPDQDGNAVSLPSLLESGPVVLFFYPKAMTPGCTKESCHFRDLASEFGELNANRGGISADSVSRQKEFATTNTLDYPLLSDEGKSIAKQFGVKRIGSIPSKRATFVIGTDFKVLAEVSSETNMTDHVDKALDTLRSAA